MLPLIEPKVFIANVEQHLGIACIVTGVGMKSFTERETGSIESQVTALISSTTSSDKDGLLRINIGRTGTTVALDALEVNGWAG